MATADQRTRQQPPNVKVVHFRCNVIVVFGYYYSTQLVVRASVDDVIIFTRVLPVHGEYVSEVATNEGLAASHCITVITFSVFRPSVILRRPIYTRTQPATGVIELRLLPRFTAIRCVCVQREEVVRERVNIASCIADYRVN